MRLAMDYSPPIDLASHDAGSTEVAASFGRSALDPEVEANF
ncbi:MAG: hypothetical protein ABR902_10950 [Candidatus Korobacteraceae bacterium]